jgi:imidazolonepropionase-like amidohydrolase
MLRDEKLNICIGTDSLASNHNLSVLSELITLQENFLGIASVEMFSWACINGAKALGIDNVYGSFEPGKKPGINLISDVDLRNLRLTSKSNVKRLI